jgi:hypothetical protein
MWSLNVQLGVEWTPTDRLKGFRRTSGTFGWMLELGFGSLVFWISTL